MNSAWEIKPNKGKRESQHSRNRKGKLQTPAAKRKKAGEERVGWEEGGAGRKWERGDAAGKKKNVKVAPVFFDQSILQAASGQCFSESCWHHLLSKHRPGAQRSHLTGTEMTLILL